MKMLLKVALLIAAVFIYANWQSGQPSSAAKAVGAVTIPVEVTAQKALDDGFAVENRWRASKVKGGPYPPDPSYIDKVDRALGEIPQDWPKSAEATALVLRLRAERPAIEKAYAAAETVRLAAIAAAREGTLLAMRKNAASIMETNFLDGGKDVYVSAEGKDLRTLRIKYILMSRPTVYAISKNDKVIGGWRDAGFHQVIMTDGYRETWTLKLN